MRSRTLALKPPLAASHTSSVIPAAALLHSAGYNKIIKHVRKYNALQLEYDTRFVKSFSVNFNYTLSRLYGNYLGLASPDEGGRANPNVNRDFDLPFVGFTASGEEAIGVLGLDRTHAFKASGTYSFDWRGSKSNSTDASFFTTVQSGLPQTSQEPRQIRFGFRLLF